MGKAKEEWGIQKAIVSWYNQQYPDGHQFHGLLTCHQNGSVNYGKIKGCVMKAMGVRAGIPDLVLYMPRGGYHALFVEVKTKDGKVSKVQKDYHARLIDQGYAVQSGQGTDHGIIVIKRYILGQIIKDRGTLTWENRKLK